MTRCTECVVIRCPESERDFPQFWFAISRALYVTERSDKQLGGPSTHFFDSGTCTKWISCLAVSVDCCCSVHRGCAHRGRGPGDSAQTPGHAEAPVENTAKERTRWRWNHNCTARPCVMIMVACVVGVVRTKRAATQHWWRVCVFVMCWVWVCGAVRNTLCRVVQRIEWCICTCYILECITNHRKRSAVLWKPKCQHGEGEAPEWVWVFMNEFDHTKVNWASWVENPRRTKEHCIVPVMWRGNTWTTHSAVHPSRSSPSPSATSAIRIRIIADILLTSLVKHIYKQAQNTVQDICIDS